SSLSRPWETTSYRNPRPGRARPRRRGPVADAECRPPTSVPARASRPRRPQARGYVPLQNPAAFVFFVPSAHSTSVVSCEKTPDGLSHPGTTHECTIQVVRRMNVPCTALHCEIVTVESAGNGTARPVGLKITHVFACRCQWSFGPAKPAGGAWVAPRYMRPMIFD